MSTAGISIILPLPEHQHKFGELRHNIDSPKSEHQQIIMQVGHKPIRISYDSTLVLFWSCKLRWNNAPCEKYNSINKYDLILHTVKSDFLINLNSITGIYLWTLYLHITSPINPWPWWWKESEFEGKTLFFQVSVFYNTNLLYNYTM